MTAKIVNAGTDFDRDHARIDQLEASMLVSGRLVDPPTAHVPTNVTFRVVDKSDLLEDWSRIIEHVAAISESNENATYTLSDFRDSLARGELSLIVMESASREELYGFVAVHDLLMPRLPRRRYLREAHVWILPKYRGSDIFSRYIEFIRGWAALNGYDGISVAIEPGNRLCPLLDHFGFTPTTVEYVWEVPKCLG